MNPLIDATECLAPSQSTADRDAGRRTQFGFRCQRTIVAIFEARWLQASAEPGAMGLYPVIERERRRLLAAEHHDLARQRLSDLVTWCSSYGFALPLFPGPIESATVGDLVRLAVKLRRVSQAEAISLP